MPRLIAVRTFQAKRTIHAAGAEVPVVDSEKDKRGLTEDEAAGFEEAGFVRWDTGTGADGAGEDSGDGEPKARGKSRRKKDE